MPGPLTEEYWHSMEEDPIELHDPVLSWAVLRSCQLYKDIFTQAFEGEKREIYLALCEYVARDDVLKQPPRKSKSLILNLAILATIVWTLSEGVEKIPSKLISILSLLRILFRHTRLTAVPNKLLARVSGPVQGLHNACAEQLRFTSRKRKRSSGDGEDVEASSQPKKKHKCEQTAEKAHDEVGLKTATVSGSDNCKEETKVSGEDVEEAGEDGEDESEPDDCKEEEEAGEDDKEVSRPDPRRHSPVPRTDRPVAGIGSDVPEDKRLFDCVLDPQPRTEEAAASHENAEFFMRGALQDPPETVQECANDSGENRSSSSSWELSEGGSSEDELVETRAAASKADPMSQGWQIRETPLSDTEDEGANGNEDMLSPSTRVLRHGAQEESQDHPDTRIDHPLIDNVHPPAVLNTTPDNDPVLPKRRPGRPRKNAVRPVIDNVDLSLSTTSDTSNGQPRHTSVSTTNDDDQHAASTPPFNIIQKTNDP